MLVVRNLRTALAIAGLAVIVSGCGPLFGWGYNGYGQLGDNTTTERHVPKRIGAATDWNAISAGTYHTVGLKN